MRFCRQKEGKMCKFFSKNPPPGGFLGIISYLPTTSVVGRLSQVFDTLDIDCEVYVKSVRDATKVEIYLSSISKKRYRRLARCLGRRL